MTGTILLFWRPRQQSRHLAGFFPERRHPATRRLYLGASLRRLARLAKVTASGGTACRIPPRPDDLLRPALMIYFQARAAAVE